MSERETGSQLDLELPAEQKTKNIILAEIARLAGEYLRGSRFQKSVPQPKDSFSLDQKPPRLVTHGNINWGSDPSGSIFSVLVSEVDSFPVTIMHLRQAVSDFVEKYGFNLLTDSHSLSQGGSWLLEWGKGSAYITGNLPDAERPFEQLDTQKDTFPEISPEKLKEWGLSRVEVPSKPYLSLFMEGLLRDKAKYFNFKPNGELKSLKFNEARQMWQRMDFYVPFPDSSIFPWFLQAMAQGQIVDTFGGDKNVPGPAHELNFSDSEMLLLDDWMSRGPALKAKSPILDRLFRSGSVLGKSRAAINNALWSNHDARQQTTVATRILKDLGLNSNLYELRLIRLDELLRLYHKKFREENVGFQVEGYRAVPNHHFGDVSAEHSALVFFNLVSSEHKALEPGMSHQSLDDGGYSTPLVIARKRSAAKPAV